MMCKKKTQIEKFSIIEFSNINKFQKEIKFKIRMLKLLRFSEWNEQKNSHNIVIPLFLDTQINIE